MITRLSDAGNTADIVYLYFIKTFESVNHRFLLAKHESFDLCKKVMLGANPI